ncbi:MAG: S24/S26 family peptidase [Dorea sp.]|nr:S24/S26 family peptidase [Dorea sp.]
MKEEKRWISSKYLFSAISDQLAENRQAVFTVTGMSMWPLLCHGRDQVIVERIERDKLKLGDIILFRITDEKYILHRITYMSDSFFQTTGDGNLFRDMQMPYECIVAKVQKIVRNGKVVECDERKWRILSRIWMKLFPIRKWIFRVWFSVRKFVRS